jgi:hypothetical protein
LANSERHRAGGNANERRTEDAGVTMKRHHASTDRGKLCGVLRYVALAW